MICLYTTITPILFTPILTFLFYKHLNTTTGTRSKIPIDNLHHLSKTHLASVFKSPQQQTVNRQICLLYRSQATWSHEPNSRHLCHGQCDVVTSQPGYVCLTFCCSHVSLSLNSLDDNACSFFISTRFDPYDTGWYHLQRCQCDHSQTDRHRSFASCKASIGTDR